MKIECPVCKSQKRVYLYHKVEQRFLEIKTLNSRVVSEIGGGCRLAWSRLRDSGSRDPGSNPGSPTIRLCLERFFRQEYRRNYPLYSHVLFQLRSHEYALQKEIGQTVAEKRGHRWALTGFAYEILGRVKGKLTAAFVEPRVSWGIQR